MNKRVLKNSESLDTFFPCLLKFGALKAKTSHLFYKNERSILFRRKTKVA